MDPVLEKIDDANAPSPTEPVIAVNLERNNANAVNAAHDKQIPIPGPASDPSSEPGHESMASSVAFGGEMKITDQVI